MIVDFPEVDTLALCNPVTPNTTEAMSDPVTEAGGDSTTAADVEQSQSTPVQLPYASRRSPLHGMGVFATRNIKAGEIIMNKRPLLTLLCPEGELHPDSYDLLLRLIRKFHTLPLTHALWCIFTRQPTLHGISLLNFQRLLHSDLPQNEATLIRAIQRAGLGYYIPAAGNQNLIVDPHLALINHACVPNAELSFDHSIATEFATEEEALFDPATITIRATKPIPAGAEITISYIHLFHTKADRASLLAFNPPGCRCRECNLVPGAQEFSDMYYDSTEDKMGFVEDFRFRRHRMPRDRSALFDGVERDLSDREAGRTFADAADALLATAQVAEIYTCALFFA